MTFAIDPTGNSLKWLAGAIIVFAMALAPISCGDTGDETATQDSAKKSVQESAQDRAARLAAQTQLRNAQTSQEVYYAENQRYASSASELKTVDDRLSPKVEVRSGGEEGFEISIVAADEQNTIYIIRKTSSRVEFVDGEGNSW